MKTKQCYLCRRELDISMFRPSTVKYVIISAYHQGTNYACIDCEMEQIKQWDREVENSIKNNLVLDKIREGS